MPNNTLSSIFDVLNYSNQFRYLSDDLSKYAIFIMKEYSSNLIKNNKLFSKDYIYASIGINSFFSLIIHPLGFSACPEDSFFDIDLKKKPFKITKRDFNIVLDNTQKTNEYINDLEQKISDLKESPLYKNNCAQIKKIMFLECLKKFNVFSNIKNAWTFCSTKTNNKSIDNIILKIIYVLFHSLEIREIIKSICFLYNLNKDKIVTAKKRYDDTIRNYEENIVKAKEDDSIIKLSLYKYKNFLNKFEIDLKDFLLVEGLLI